MAVRIDTYSNSKLNPYRNPDQAKTDAFAWAPSLTVAKGTVCGFITADNVASPYDADNTDGTGTASIIAEYAFTTDADGLVSYAANPTKYNTAPAYTQGDFLVDELTGLDDDATEQLGRVENGVLVMR